MQEVTDHEIDISGRLEILNNHSVLAIGGPLFSYSVLLSKDEKPQLKQMIQIAELERFERSKRKPRSKHNQDLRIMGIMLFYILSKCPDSIDLVILDRDYDKGAMRNIKRDVRRLLQQAKEGPKNLSIVIGAAGKGMAHDIAIRAYRTGKADMYLSAEEIMEHY